MFDITQQAVNDTASIHLKAADGTLMYDADKKPLRIRIYGPGSKAYQAIEQRQTQRAMKRREDNGGKATLAAPEAQTTELAEDLASITIAFEGFGYPPAGDAAGEALFRAFYADTSLGFIAAQVWKSCQDWAVFRKGSPTS